MENGSTHIRITSVNNKVILFGRDITADGRMTKRQLATAYRGYHGLESQYYALRHVSNGTMINAHHKNERLQNRHVEDMKHLTQQEKIVKNKTERDLKTLRDDFTAQLAYQYVYKNHSFKRLYRSQTSKKVRPDSDKPEMYDQERKRSAKENTPRPLGSLRQAEAYNDELKFPPIKTSEPNQIPSPRVNMMGNKYYNYLKDNHEKTIKHEGQLTSFPSIQGAMAVEIRFKSAIPEDDKGSIISAPPAKLDADAYTEEEREEISKLKSLDMAQNLLIRKLRQQERFEPQRKLLPLTPSASPELNSKHERREGWRRILPETPLHQSSVFPGRAKTSLGVRNFLKSEASEVTENWLPSVRRQQIVEKAKGRNKVELYEHPIPVIDHQRPISAIFRDYREYKRQQEEWKQAREKEDDNNSVIVRQMSPQPRVASPVSQRRSEYASRIMTPMKKNRNATESPNPFAKENKLRRTESEKSEKLTSVSRTSSYREIPVEELKKIRENRNLTSAQRIEKEKQKLNKEDTNENTSRDLGLPPRVKRRLPPAPAQRVKHHPKKNFETKMPTRNPVSTPITMCGRDSKPINSVSEANEAHEDKAEESKPNSSFTAEHIAYMPIIKQVGATATGTSDYSADNLRRMRIASALHDHTLWPKLKKRMSFNYENFTRAPLDSKKRLEVKAKNRKKIHMKNAKIEAEIKKRQEAPEAERQIERAQTRVSFNENVVVFQTI